MAEMIIDIINPQIELISGETFTSNSCFSIYEFYVNSTPGASITVIAEKLNLLVEDYTYVGVNISGTWYDIAEQNVFVLPATGQAKVRIVIPNANLVRIKVGPNACNRMRITIQDTTNGKTESKEYSRCTAGNRCVYTSEETNPTHEKVIDQDTNVLIYFDSSGSMENTLPPLQEMRDTLLKTTLLPYYNNNSTLYDSKVKVIQDASEMAFQMMNYQDQNLTGKVIVLVFQNEADTYYGPNTFDATTARTPDYDRDLKAFRERLLSFSVNYYHGVMFQVTLNNMEGTNFKAMLDACEKGYGSYSGIHGLSDKDNITFKYDINDGDTAAYYNNLVETSLNELGFTV